MPKEPKPTQEEQLTTSLLAESFKMDAMDIDKTLAIDKKIQNTKQNKP